MRRSDKEIEDIIDGIDTSFKVESGSHIDMDLFAKVAKERAEEIVRGFIGTRINHLRIHDALALARVAEEKSKEIPAELKAAIAAAPKSGRPKV